MDKVIFPHQNITLAKLSKVVRSFTRAWTSEDEKKLCWIWRKYVRSSQFIFQLGINLFATFSSINSNTVLPLLKAFHDGLCLCLKCLDSFLHCLWIIVSSSACLASLSHAVDKSLSRALKVDKIPDNNLICELLFELIPIFLIAWKTIKQVSSIPIC